MLFHVIFNCFVFPLLWQCCISVDKSSSLFVLWEKNRLQSRRRFKGYMKFRRDFRLSCISAAVTVLMTKMWWKLLMFAVLFRLHFALKYNRFGQIRQHKKNGRENILKLAKDGSKQLIIIIWYSVIHRISD